MYGNKYPVDRRTVYLRVYGEIIIRANSFENENKTRTGCKLEEKQF